MRARHALCLLLLSFTLASLTGCQPLLIRASEGAGSARDWLQNLGRGRVQGIEALAVTIRADGQDLELRTEGRTVREALDQAGVSVGAEDRVEPDLWVELTDEFQ